MRWKGQERRDQAPAGQSPRARAYEYCFAKLYLSHVMGNHLGTKRFTVRSFISSSHRLRLVV